MEFKCNKTGRIFTTKLGLLNHLRFIYDTIEHAYLEEMDISIPECVYCGDNAKFISFFKGYHSYCNNKKCMHEFLSGVQKLNGVNSVKNKENNLVYVDYILSNIDWYKDNIHNKDCIDPFYGISTGCLTLNMFLTRRVSLSALEEDRVCSYCGDTFTCNVFDPKQVCGGRRCTAKRTNGYQPGVDDTPPMVLNNRWHYLRFVEGLNITTARGVMKTEYKLDIDWKSDIIAWGSTSINRLYTCPETGWVIPLSEKTNNIGELLKIHEIPVIPYYEKHLPQYIKYCDECGSLVMISKDLVNEPSRRFCSHSCYVKYSISHPSEYEMPDSQRELQSTIMKSLIRDGKFKPRTNNAWSKIINWGDHTFRSTWELAFHVLHPTYEYETIVIPYTNCRGLTQNYITDFFDRNNGVVYEIKPSSMLTSFENKNKIVSGRMWCSENGYAFEVITEDYFKKVLDNINFDGWSDSWKKSFLKGVLKKYENS